MDQHHQNGGAFLMLKNMGGMYMLAFALGMFAVFIMLLMLGEDCKVDKR